MMAMECVGPAILTLERSSRFSRRAREYMMAYHLLIKSGVALTPVDLEHLKQGRESHMGVVAIYFAWISDFTKEIEAETRH